MRCRRHYTKEQYGALWKLIEYEDTGLSPKEVELLSDNVAKAVSESKLKDIIEQPAEEQRFREEWARETSSLLKRAGSSCNCNIIKNYSIKENR